MAELIAREFPGDMERQSTFGYSMRGHGALTIALREGGARVPEILVDQGKDDNFLEEQLKPELLEKACSETGIDLTLRWHSGCDHSYYFISTFMAEHVAWHAERLG